MRTTLVLLITLALATPMAAANWTYRGNNEPDTAYDDATYMFLEPDASAPGHKVYFNGFGRVARETHYNPNVGALGTRIQPPVTAMSAMLGFWKDCNNDGYVGLAETAALEYRAELLSALGGTGICPPATPTTSQSIYPYNDGTWVRELIWIGPKSLGAIGAPSGNPTNYYADGTGVWGDWGLPGAPPVLVCNGAANAGARSTGAILDLVDCQTYYTTVRTLNDVDPEGNTVGGWETEDIDNSDSPANVDNPAYVYLYGPAEPEGHQDEGDYRGYSGGFLGRDTDENDRRQRMVTVVDCDTNTVDTSPEVNQPGDVNDPSTYPSAYESLNDTFEVATQSGSDRCAQNSSSDEGFPYQVVHPEQYTENVFADQGRLEVDFPFEFSVGSRNVVPGGRCSATQGYQATLLGYCPPADLGTAAERDDFAIGPAWRTNAQINTYSISTREQLQGEEPDFGGWYFTFYARLGDAVFSLPGASAPRSVPSTYGAEACGLATSGVIKGWNCDPAAWQARCADPNLPTLPAQCYRVGFKYHARDVDCWDNTVVRGVGLHAGLSDVSPSGPCKDHPSNAAPDLPVG